MRPWNPFLTPSLVKRFDFPIVLLHKVLIRDRDIVVDKCEGDLEALVFCSHLEILSKMVLVISNQYIGICVT